MGFHGFMREGVDVRRDRAARWLPQGYDVVRRDYRFGGVGVRLFQVRDPTAVIDALDVETFRSRDERFPYWCEVWPSALALARYLAASPLVGPGVRVVELGCGTGLCGVVAALRGAQVTYTDIDPEALAFARANHALNLGEPGRIRRLDWREPPRNLRADLVIAADVLYEARFLPPFVATLRRLCGAKGAAVVAEPGRDVARGVVEALEAEGFRRGLHLEEVDVGHRVQGVWIHAVARRRRPLERG